MPWQVMIAICSAALLWGWPRVAGAVALAWGGMLRVGEVLDAIRSDLLLPQDVQRTADFAMMSIRTPKPVFAQLDIKLSGLTNLTSWQLLSWLLRGSLPMRSCGRHLADFADPL